MDCLNLVHLISLLITYAFVHNASSWAANPCTFPLKLGRTCNYATPEQSTTQRFYYNADANCCSPFTYLGCDGNQNNYFDADHCINACVLGASDDEVDTPMKEARTKQDCFQQPDPGICRALIPMWYYSFEKDDCDQFSYGGCRGKNLNIFDGIEECEEFCKGVVEEGNTNWTGLVGVRKGMC